MAATLLYDPDCGICVATARWLRQRVAPDRLRLLPLVEAGNDPALADRVRGRDLSTALHFVRSDGRVLTGARAVLAAGRLAPRWRALAWLFDHRIGHRLLEPIYRQVAIHRRAIGRALRLPETCEVVPDGVGSADHHDPAR
jgi:predicted DCC family thiol-disulfide oxidoreductase YuxK